MKTRTELRELARTHWLARHTLVAFLCTFVLTRSLVLFMAEGRLPDLHMRIGETHIHHLSIGILLVVGVGAALLFVRPVAGGLRAVASVYGIGLALTFDEFGMWLRLEDVYWQRASFDAIVVIAATLGLVAAGPSLRHLRPRHWTVAVGLAIAVTLLALLVFMPLWSAGRNFGAHLR